MSEYVYDIKAAPNRQVTLPTTVPLPSLKAHRLEQEVALQAEAAKFQKAMADYEAAKTKAAAEGTELPKPPVKVLPKKEANDLVTPVPSEAKDPDLLRLVELLGEGAEEAFEQSGELVCQVAKERILDALRFCRDDSALRYEMLSDETATHFPASASFAFSVVYHLTSLSRTKRLRLRILIPEGFEPESAAQIYPAANWLEREVFDMLGIRFGNHPDLVRILCPDDWEDYPLRKEYPVAGWGQRDIDFREDRSGMLERLAMEKAGNTGINLKVPKAE
jgi:NADH-quinone oxidoreductase subunit C